MGKTIAHRHENHNSSDAGSGFHEASCLSGLQGPELLPGRMHVFEILIAGLFVAGTFERGQEVHS